MHFSEQETNCGDTGFYSWRVADSSTGEDRAPLQTTLPPRSQYGCVAEAEEEEAVGCCAHYTEGHAEGISSRRRSTRCRCTLAPGWASTR